MMINNPLSRRSFFKFSLIALSTIAAGPIPLSLPDDYEEISSIGIGRISAESINIYKSPDFSGEREGKFYRDTLVNLHEQIRSPRGPERNPRWYRTDKGFIHSAYVQRVEKQHLNLVPDSLPDKKVLGEITVAYTQASIRNRQGDWFPLYRLYFRSNHWITAIIEGPDGKPWYQIKDERLFVNYYVPAQHIKLFPLEIFQPLFSQIPLLDKRIVISIGEQRLVAFHGEKEIREMKISSGLPNRDLTSSDIPTETPTGSFHVSVKWPVRHMGNGYLTDDLEAYELPGVPWSMFFHESGYALHGAYWHDNFGYRMSHGCVNLRPQDAQWLFRWTDPVYEPGTWYTRGKGTLVLVQE